MKGEEIIVRLRENEAAFHDWGVTHAALVGSLAGDERPESDTDILIEFNSGGLRGNALPRNHLESVAPFRSHKNGAIEWLKIFP